MSVYRPRSKGAYTSPFFQYDFQLNGRRFHGSTGATTRREALEVEHQERAEAKSAGDDSTIEGGFARWWNEVGQHDADAHGTTFPRLEALQDTA